MNIATRVASLFNQFERVTDVSPGKQVGVLAFFDALAQDTGRTEIRDDLDPCRFMVLVPELAHNLAQAARGEHV